MILWMQNLTNWLIHVRTAWKRNSTESTLSTPTHVLLLDENVKKSTVVMLLCTVEKEIVTDTTTV